MLYILHEVRGKTGLSPYEIIFGRPRPIAGLPYDPPRECENSGEFLICMEEIDRKVAHIINEKHKLLASRLNKARREREVLEIGSKVWYRRPENSGTKLDSRWLGPALVVAREGAHSYQIEVKPGTFIKTHRSFLKSTNLMHSTHNQSPYSSISALR